jgi:glycine cleavage system regulatory protein
MATSLVLTLIGTDQPGLVEMLSQTVATHGGSWEHSRMARLGGYFAGILEVSVPKNQAASLFKSLHELEARGLKVMVRDAADDPLPAETRVLRLELVGQDRPGIVMEISSALAAIQVNVVELSTECSPAPMSGETLFSATAELHHPLDHSIEALRETLEKIASDLMVDLQLDESTD